MRTLKGPGIFLAQFIGTEPPFVRVELDTPEATGVADAQIAAVLEAQTEPVPRRVPVPPVAVRVGPEGGGEGRPAVGPEVAEQHHAPGADLGVGRVDAGRHGR